MSQMKGSKNVSKMAFFLLPLGIAVNFIGGQVAALLRNLPIYLDAIGTMVVAALCGPIYSVATALVGSADVHHSPTNLVYIGNYLAVGLFSGLFAYLGLLQKRVEIVHRGRCGRPVLRCCRLHRHRGGYGRLQRQHPRHHHRLPCPDFLAVHPGGQHAFRNFHRYSGQDPLCHHHLSACVPIPNKFLLKLPYGNKYIWGAKKEEAKTEQAK